jgi:hypothetical protein
MTHPGVAFRAVYRFVSGSGRYLVVSAAKNENFVNGSFTAKLHLYACLGTQTDPCPNKGAEYNYDPVSWLKQRGEVFHEFEMVAGIRPRGDRLGLAGS